MWMTAKQTLCLHHSANPPQQAPLLLPVPLHCCERHLPHRLGSRQHPAGPLFRPLSGRNPTATFFIRLGASSQFLSASLTAFTNFLMKLNYLMPSELQPPHLHCPCAFPVYLPAVFVCCLLVFSPSIVIAAAQSPTGPMRIGSSSSAQVLHINAKLLYMGLVCLFVAMTCVNVTNV